MSPSCTRGSPARSFDAPDVDKPLSTQAEPHPRDQSPEPGSTKLGSADMLPDTPIASAVPCQFWPLPNRSLFLGMTTAPSVAETPTPELNAMMFEDRCSVLATL